ncbi:MAG TPA: hypothetical protein VF546_25685 [Pyrinomonadaceae bacterium]
MKLKYVLSCLSCVLLLCGFAAAQDKSAWTWQHTDTEKDGGWRRVVKVEGRAEFNEDYTDVQSLSPDGRFLVEEERGGVLRRYEVRPGADGALVRAYTLNGAAHAFDADARRWYEGLLLLAARQGGLDARTRVARLLRRRGVDGVLTEIRQLEGDYARRVYFDELLKTASLDHAGLKKALEAVAAGGIMSDYERAELLRHVAPAYVRADALVPVYFSTLDGIKSDYERRRVLTHVLRLPDLSAAARRRLLTSAAALTSDYEKATLLITAAAAAGYLDDETLRLAFAAAVNTIGSDHERGRVLRATARRTGN